jgi:hypothetical protein
MKYFHKNHIKKLQITETPIAFHLLLRLAYQNITLITAHTTLTPTCKLNGKTRVHTVFYLDSFGQEMPSLVLIKEQYFHSSFPIRLLVVVFFGTQHSSIDSCCAREKKYEYRCVLIVYEKSLISNDFLPNAKCQIFAEIS